MTAKIYYYIFLDIALMISYTYNSRVLSVSVHALLYTFVSSFSFIFIVQFTRKLRFYLRYWKFEHDTSYTVVVNFKFHAVEEINFLQLLANNASFRVP